MVTLGHKSSEGVSSVSFWNGPSLSPNFSLKSHAVRVKYFFLYCFDLRIAFTPSLHFTLIETTKCSDYDILE